MKAKKPDFSRQFGIILLLNEPAPFKIPTDFALQQNYPNPFNPETTIRYQLPKASDVTLTIYNLRGQLVWTLISGPISAGRHKVVWDGNDERGVRAASSVYVLQLKTKGFLANRTLVFAK